jgi:hypothetical protein
MAEHARDFQAKQTAPLPETSIQVASLLRKITWATRVVEGRPRKSYGCNPRCALSCIARTTHPSASVRRAIGQDSMSA